MHLKRYLIPTYWRVAKKSKTFVTSPSPGPHKKSECIPLLVLVRDVLKFCETAEEGKKIIKRGEILVDKKVRKDHRFPVGFMDVVEIPKIKKFYRVLVNKYGLYLEEINEEEASKKLCRIQGKRKVRNGLIQLNLHDGRNILTDKNDYKTHDSLLIEIPSQKIIKHFAFEKNMPALIFSGRNKGIKGKVKEIYERKKMQESSRVVLQTKDGEIETVKDYILVGEIA